MCKKDEKMSKKQLDERAKMRGEYYLKLRELAKGN